jgi:hypothetical protein
MAMPIGEDPTVTAAWATGARGLLKSKGVTDELPEFTTSANVPLGEIAIP